MLSPTTILILLFYTDSNVSASPSRRAGLVLLIAFAVYIGNFQPS